MGRKEGQRTKGNTKVFDIFFCDFFIPEKLHEKQYFLKFQPSSSARTAELLSTNLGNSSVIGDLELTSAIFGLKPLTTEEENLIPDDLKLALKKMSKKDVTTKLKVSSFIQSTSLSN